MLEKKVKSKARILINAIHICITNFIFGYTIGVFNTCQDNVAHTMGWSSSQKSLYSNLFSTFIPLGALIGSLITGYLSNKLGRLATILTLDILTTIGSVLSVIPQTVVFGLGRLIAGVACGMCMTIAPIYISEMTPRCMMGTIGPIMSTMLSIGLTLSYALSFALPSEDFSQDTNQFWQFMFGVPGIVAIYQFVWFSIIIKYDTPLFYSRSKNYSKYQKSLLSLFNEEDIPEESLFIQTAEQDQSNIEHNDSYKKLICDKTNSKMVRIGAILGVFQQFSGINAVFFYSFAIYQKIGMSVIESKIFTVSIGFTYFISSILTIFILKLIGRKTSLMIGHGLICVVLLLMGFISNFEEKLSYFLSALVIVYILLFNFGLSATLWSYVGEIQTERAISITVSLNYIANIFIIFMFPLALNLVGVSNVFYFFGICMLFAVIYIKYDTFETRNKSKLEIEIELRGKNSKVSTIETENR